MIKVMCVYPTILEQGGYINRDEVVSIPEALTKSSRIQRNFVNLDGSPIEPICDAVEPEPMNDIDGELSGYMSLTKDDLLHKAQALGIATSTRMTKETIARLIYESGVVPTLK